MLTMIPSPPPLDAYETLAAAADAYNETLAAADNAYETLAAAADAYNETLAAADNAYDEPAPAPTPARVTVPRAIKAQFRRRRLRMRSSNLSLA